MGHKERLFEAATELIRERGYANISARDLVARSGTNLGSIGYHYGTKEALLNQAIFAAVDEWGDDLVRRIDRADGDSPLDRIHAFLAELHAAFEETRPLWISTFEALPPSIRSPELMAQLALGQGLGRRGLAARLLGVDEDRVDDETARSHGGLMFTLMAGAAAQWIVDFEHSPTPDDLFAALRELTALRE